MRIEISHFWFGKSTSKDHYFDFCAESEDYYLEDDVNEDEKYISEFAKSQDENWLDHDFMESGFEDQEISFEEKFIAYSYASQWLPESKKRLAKENYNLSEINTIIFISKDQIEKPVSIDNLDCNLLYIGEIEYEI